VYDCVKAFSETDMAEDMRKVNIPVLLLHGDDDQVVSIDASAKVGIKLLKKGTLKIYPGGSHALPLTEKHKVNNHLLEFLKVGEICTSDGDGEGGAGHA